jgi:hypothetical protein
MIVGKESSLLMIVNRQMCHSRTSGDQHRGRRATTNCFFFDYIYENNEQRDQNDVPDFLFKSCFGLITADFSDPLAPYRNIKFIKYKQKKESKKFIPLFYQFFL